MHWTTTKKLTSAIILMLIYASFLSAKEANAQYGLEDVQDDTLSKSILIHPPIKTQEGEFIVSREHVYKSHLQLGDQLGRDFVISKVSENGTMEVHKNKGESNQDYFGWRNNVLAPFYGTVTKVNHPEKTNKPGVMDREKEPGKVTVKNKNDVVVTFVHVREISVEQGETIEPGDVIAKIGNNGTSRGPHVHIGAWKGETPLQIQVDLYANERYR